MISFCIPIYNCDVSNLVTILDRQATSLGLAFEILLIDDHSSMFKDQNAELAKIKSVRYIALDGNIGRARIRNLFPVHARCQYLLFLDCDSVIVSDEFVRRYHQEIRKGPQVICGGRIYPESPGSRDKKLHWKYGVLKESMPADIRSAHPNESFMTNNFVIHKEIFERIQFDERIIHYGHEDTLFGYCLMKNNILVKHIENPVLHGSLEDYTTFVEKTESGLINLSRILNHMGHEAGFKESVKMLKFHEKIKSTGLLTIIKPLCYSVCPIIRQLLSSGWASLFLFNVYKFGFFTLNSSKVPQDL